MNLYLNLLNYRLVVFSKNLKNKKEKKDKKNNNLSWLVLNPFEKIKLFDILTTSFGVIQYDLDVVLERNNIILILGYIIYNILQEINGYYDFLFSELKKCNYEYNVKSKLIINFVRNSIIKTYDYYIDNFEDKQELNGFIEILKELKSIHNNMISHEEIQGILEIERFSRKIFANEKISFFEIFSKEENFHFIDFFSRYVSPNLIKGRGAAIKDNVGANGASSKTSSDDRASNSKLGAKVIIGISMLLFPVVWAVSYPVRKLYKSVQNLLEYKTKTSFMKTGMRFVGYGAGGYAGFIGGLTLATSSCIKGCVVGAALGTIVPGIGTAIGGLIGGVVGSFIGFYLGKQLGRFATYLLHEDTNPDKWRIPASLDKKHSCNAKVYESVVEGNYILSLIRQRRGKLGVTVPGIMPRQYKTVTEINNAAHAIRHAKPGSYMHCYPDTHKRKYNFFQCSSSAVSETEDIKPKRK